MQFPMDERFLEERERYRLRHTCEYCSFFDAKTGTCRHGWPNEEHREAWYEGAGDRIVFCKEFELR
ncbi:MAG: hypothetical protein J7M25_06450 [Deltaproteobacteria bacterium]|nr:hypothetical protein [Deltaproteobacteria bacterium]